MAVTTVFATSNPMPIHSVLKNQMSRLISIPKPVNGSLMQMIDEERKLSIIYTKNVKELT